MSNERQARMDRECKGCDGSGCAGGCAYVFHCRSFSRDVDARIDRGHTTCPGCLGSGRVEDRVTVAQAMEDAATWTDFMVGDINETIFGPRTDALEIYLPAIRCIEILSRLDNETRFRREFMVSADQAQAHALAAARAAFRAVPALRGGACK